MVAVALILLPVIVCRYKAMLADGTVFDERTEDNQLVFTTEEGTYHHVLFNMRMVSNKYCFINVAMMQRKFLSFWSKQ